MKFAAIANWAATKTYDVTFMCAQLGVSRSGYYAWAKREASARSRQDATLSTLIVAAHKQGRGNSGVRRVHAALAASGHRVGRKRVHRLMRALGLQGRHPKAYKQTTVHGDHPLPAPDLIGRHFTAPAANTRWCGDITYVRTWDGWSYLATVIDLHDRTVVGWAVADHMRTSLVIDALQMAITHHRPPPGVIFHSDRGCQYTSKEFAAFCTANNVTRSLGRTGICYDNALAESFNATYKKELVHTRPWPTLADLKRETFDWIETYYNTRRRHSALGYLTPREYRLGYRTIKQLAA